MGAPRMKPRLSMPITWLIESAANGAAIASVARRNAAAFASSGVMSLKLIPGFGKFGISRMSGRSSRSMSAREGPVTISPADDEGFGHRVVLVDGECAHLLYVAVRRSSTYGCEQRLDMARASERRQLDRSILAIANPSGNVESLCNRAHEFSKADSLHAARHFDVREDLTQRGKRRKAVSTADSTDSSVMSGICCTSTSPSRTRAAIRISASAISMRADA